MEQTRDEKSMRNDAERLADIFTVLQRCFIGNLSKELSRGNISFPQYFLLGYMVQQKHLSMSEIAARMGHTTAAATGLIDRLENLNFVKRSHGLQDRRKIMVQITPVGIALVAKVREDMIDNLLNLMKVLTTDEQKWWLQIYEKIFEQFKNKPCASF